MIDKLIRIAKEAGKEIMDVYKTDFDVEYKGDKSPLTEADKKSNNVICRKLKSISDYPILSEEGRNIPYKERKNWEYLWIVDPLDGTKEFIKRNGEFTVNIALIHRGRPYLGVVYAPAMGTLYYGGKDIGVYKNGNAINLPVKEEKGKKEITAVVSKSHLNEETSSFLGKLKNFFNKVNTVSIGSSLKICLIAEGKADIYPRLAPTMEWDTAAAHAILIATGGRLVKYKEIENPSNLRNLTELRYNKKNLLNPYFVAFRSDVF